jgi:hypothetical protein
VRDIKKGKETEKEKSLLAYLGLDLQKQELKESIYNSDDPMGLLDNLPYK